MPEIQLPKGWVWKKIGEATIINPKLSLKDIPADLPVSFLPMKLVEEITGRFSLTENRRYSEVKKGFTAFQNGDVIFAKITPCMENGKMAVVDGLENGIGFGSTEFHVFRCQEGLYNQYLFYYLVQSHFRYEAEGNMTGAVGQRRVPKSFLEDYSIPYPPLPVQQAIVAKIEELFSELDAGVKELQTALNRLKTYRQSVLNYHLSNSDWQRVRLGDVSKVYVGSTPSRKITNYWNGEVNWVSSGEVAFRDIWETRERITDLGLDNSSTTVHPVGTVLLAMIGEGKTRGQAAILQIDAAHNQNTAAIRPNKDFITTKFLYNHLVRSYYDNRRIGSGNNQQALNKLRIQEMIIHLPSIETQTQIVLEMEVLLSEADAMENIIRQELVRAEDLRQSILKRAFEGKLLKLALLNTDIEVSFDALEPTNQLHYSRDSGMSGKQLSLF